jgi:large subunit ribosomal protein L4
MAIKAKVIDLNNKAAGEVNLASEVFGVEVRKDIMSRVVNWQLAKRRAGTHKTKTISEIRGGGAKPWRQKGTGRARQGSIRSPQFRGGAVVFGPTPRDHGFKLPKKVRKLGLKSALSAKQAEGKLVILKDAKATSVKTKDLANTFRKLGWANALIIGGETLDDNFAVAAGNLPNIDVLPSAGANVYDILRRDVLVLTQDAVEQLEARLK